MASDGQSEFDFYVGGSPEYLPGPDLDFGLYVTATFVDLSEQFSDKGTFEFGARGDYTIKFSEPRRVCRRLIDLSYAAISGLSRAA